MGFYQLHSSRFVSSINILSHQKILPDTSVWFTRTHRGLIPTDFIFFAQAILSSGGVRHYRTHCIVQCVSSPLPSRPKDYEVCKREKWERERETRKNVTVCSAAAALRNLAESEGNGVCASTTSTGQLHMISVAWPDPHNGATLIPALCMWILDPDLGVEGEWGQRLVWLIGFGDGVTAVGGDVAHMQLIATSSILMCSDKVVNWGKGASVDISRVWEHCVLRLWGKRVVPRLADIGEMMQPVARSAFCAVSRALAVGLMRPSSAKPTNSFCGGRCQGRLTSRTWRRPRSWAYSWSQGGPVYR